jgi:hypothetical protein
MNSREMSEPSRITTSEPTKIKNMTAASDNPIDNHDHKWSLHDNKSTAGVSSSSSSSHSRSSDEVENDGVEDRQDRLERCSTTHSAFGDAPVQPIDSVIEVPDDFYDRLPKHRKSM